MNPQSQAKERVKKTMENPKENPKEPMVRPKFPKAQATVKHWKIRNQFRWERLVSLIRSLIHKEWRPDERNSDWSLDALNDELC